MNAEPFDLETGFAGVEIFILYFALCAPVHSIIVISAEFLDIKVVGASSDFFIRRKGNA